VLNRDKVTHKHMPLIDRSSVGLLLFGESPNGTKQKLINSKLFWNGR